MVRKIVKLGMCKNLKSSGFDSGLFWEVSLFAFIVFFKPNCSKQQLLHLVVAP